MHEHVGAAGLREPAIAAAYAINDAALADCTPNERAVFLAAMRRIIATLSAD